MTRNEVTKSRINIRYVLVEYIITKELTKSFIHVKFFSFIKQLHMNSIIEFNNHYTTDSIIYKSYLKNKYCLNLKLNVELLRRAMSWIFITKLLFCYRVFLSKLNPNVKNLKIWYKRVELSVEKPDP